MRIVSLNCWGGALFDALAAWLPHCGADVLCLQEVTRTPRLGGWTRFSDAERELRQRANLFDDVADLLHDHQGFFVASDAGPVTGDDGAVHRQDFGLAIFVDERFPVVGQEASFIHGSFVDHEDWAINDRPRLAQAVRILDRDQGRYVAAVHAHGLRHSAGKHDIPERLAQAERLAAVTDAVREDADLTIVCGDLNVLPASRTFDVLAQIGLVDLVGAADTRTTSYPKPVRHANYLLVSETTAVRRFDIQASPEVSDHRPLVLDI